jgi:hypothetical protein
MIFKTKVKNAIYFLLFSVIFAGGCSYSFTGASVPPHLKSISIPLCIDRSGSGQPGMSDNFTDKLIEKFTNDNTLQVTDKSNADAVVECSIVSLNDMPAVIGVKSGGENVSERRVTLNVKVIYRDFVQKKVVFNKNFTNYADYSNTGDVYSLKNAAIDEAIDKITEDILLGVVSNW